MANNLLDLWPERLVPLKLLAPVTIMREQATLLGQKTQNVLTAYVETTASQNRITHSFDVRASALGGFKVALFRASHGIAPYPVDISQFRYSDEGRKTDTIYFCESEQEFISTLKKVFASETTLSVVEGLLAQSQSSTAQSGYFDVGPANADDDEEDDTGSDLKPQ